MQDHDDGQASSGPEADADAVEAQRLLAALRRELAGDGAVVVAGRYEFGERLGQGAHGTVHAARDRLTGDTVAIKLLPPLVETDLVRLRGEIAALRLLRLPGVVHLFDEGTDQGRPFLVMERVVGEPFPGARPAGSPRWTWEQLAPVTLALLDTLGRVHAAGLVHRDLKPRNVLVTAAGRPVLLDFGLSVGRALSDDSVTDSTALGTPAYAAPEQVRGEPVDARADLYALGVMLWEALAGRRPHEASRISGILRSRLAGPVESIARAAPGVPPAVAEVLDSLLEVEREARPRSAVETAERLVGGHRAGPDEPRLAFVGRDEPLARLLEAARAGRPACVVGLVGSGRTRLLHEAAGRLEEEGRRVLWTAPASRPFESLELLAPWVAEHEPPSLDAARTALTGALHEALRSGLVLIADDLHGLDEWSRSVLDAPQAGAVLSSCLPEGARPPGTLVELPALGEAGLRALFAGSDRLLHVHEDAARELHDRTAGQPASVQAELLAWMRAGLAEQVGSHVQTTRADVDRLRAGVPVLPIALAGGEPRRPLDDDVDELLAWIHLAWPATDLTLLAQISGRTAWLLDAELEKLVDAAAARRMPDGRVRPLRPARRLADAGWLSAAGLAAHSALGDGLAAGAPGRLYHLVAAGQHEAAAREAQFVGRAQLQAGRLGEAEVALAEGLRAARRLSGPVARDLELDIVRDWLPVALGDVTPVACDRLLYETSRSHHRDAVLLQLEKLLRAAVAAYDKDGAAALAAASAVPPFADELNERWRHALRVRAARRCPLAEEERVVAEACDWASRAADPRTAANRDEWRGRLCYRQGRFGEAAELNLRAADAATTTTARLSALLNAASALLEAGRPDECEAVARRAEEVAAECRLSWFEGRARWLVRSAAYRRGEDLAPDVELVDAMARVGALDQAAVAALTEAAFAWRRRDAALATDLAGRALRGWASSGFRDGHALARGLQGVAARAQPSPDDVARMVALIRSCALQRVAAQVTALLAQTGADVPEELRRAAVEAARATPDRRLRLELLSPAEILAALGA